MEPAPTTPGPARLALATLLLAVALSGHRAAAEPATPSETARAPGEARLEARLIAPCCWTQTLDVHQSEISTSLRREIRTRLLAGEAPEAIEDDLAARYGERIRAVARGHEIGGPIPLVVGVGALAAAAALIAMVRRWRRVAAVSLPAPLPGGRTDAYDAILDEELRALDE